MFKRCLMINRNLLKSRLKHKKQKRQDRRLLMLKTKLKSLPLKQRRLRPRQQPLLEQLMHNKRELLMKPRQQKTRPRQTKPVLMPLPRSMMRMPSRLRKPEEPQLRLNRKLIAPSMRLKLRDVSRRYTIDNRRKLQIARKGMMLRLQARKHLSKLKSKPLRLRLSFNNKLWNKR